jgi:hypothetical protein
MDHAADAATRRLGRRHVRGRMAVSGCAASNIAAREISEKAAITRPQRPSKSHRDDLDSGPRRYGNDPTAEDADGIAAGPDRPGSTPSGHGVVIGDSWVSEVERVGGRRRLRGEVVMLAIGLLFLGAALFKPWTLAGSAQSPSPSPSSAAPAEIAAIPTTNAARVLSVVPTPSPSSMIPPYDYRWGFPFPTEKVPTGATQTGVPVIAEYSWPAVDWTALSVPDADAGWGFAAAVMTSASDAAGATGTRAPQTLWTSFGSPPVYAGVSLASNQNVYAMAVTWPSDLVVKRVSFIYLGGPEHPVYMPPAAFLPNSRVTPLPAVGVASAFAVSAAGSQIRSGEFLIPPTSASPNFVTSSIHSSWSAQPWPWPYGAYQVTVTSTTGTTRAVIDLLLTD